MMRALLLTLCCLAVGLAFAKPPVVAFIRGPGFNPYLVDLVAYWPLSEASGSRSDSHSNGITLTQTNGVGSATGLISALAADFEETSNQWLEASDSTTLSLGADSPFTVTAWVKIESLLTGTRTVLGKRLGSAAADTEIRITVDSDEHVEFRVANGSTFTTITDTNATLTTSSWAFIVCWHDADGNSVNIQVNDGPVTTGGWSGGTFDGAGLFQIGAVGSNTSADWDGLIEGVGYWKRILTSDERSHLFNSGSGRSYPFQ